MSAGAGARTQGGTVAGRDDVHVCAFCGERFTEDRGQPACRSCPLAEACRFVRCPSCHYENPVEPGWIGRLRALWPGAGERGPA